MAEQEYEVKITWENDNFFKMEEKEPGGSWITIVQVNENTHIKEITSQLSALCKSNFAVHLDLAIKEMEV